MKTLEVRELRFKEAFPDLDEVSEMLDQLNMRVAIGELNWEDFHYKPDVTFSMAYTRNEILLKYYVTEDYFKAEKTRTNEMVCEDSCVEFFVSPEDDGIYYNLEFNGIGTCLMGSGTGRENSTRVDPLLVDGIRRKSSAGTRATEEKKGKFSWTITLAIPFRIFFRHDIRELKGKMFRANFYKCGDNLSVPHYVTWNPVETKMPDYHRPEFFGFLKFV